MISGDHLKGCINVALETGILTKDDLKKENAVLTGEEFRKQLEGTYDLSRTKEEGIFVDAEALKTFRKIKEQNKIIARSTAEDKMIFTRGIQQQKGVVAIAGDGTADLEVLKAADVGLAMGTGCQVAKDNSDLVILDDDFGSIRKAFIWGRTTFQNVNKFLQFQLTINITCVVFFFIVSLTTGQFPFNVIQLLWINLIMDVLAAIALCTEPPMENNIQKDQLMRVSKGSGVNIIRPNIRINIFGQVCYQLLVLLFLNYFGTFIFFDESFNLVTLPEIDSDFKYTDRMTMDTILFHTFVLMNLFNQLNSRVVDAEEKNAFKNLLNNKLFIIVLAAEFVVQYIFVDASNFSLGPYLLGCAPLSTGQRITCWVLGALSLGVFPLIKMIPPTKLAFLNNFSLERQTTMADSILDGARNHVQQR